jgi:23S rRNA (cytosine1962-C5)-methyltransferase
MEKMTKYINVIVKASFSKRMKDGYPLIHGDAVNDRGRLKEEGVLLQLFDESNHYIGKGYYGRQNKGVGWILTNNKDERIDADFFKKKIEEAIQHRKFLFNDPDTTAFRIFNGEGDGIGGLTIDYFDSFYLIQWYSEGIYSFKKEVITSLQELVTFKGIYQKKRFASNGAYVEEDDFVAGERGEFPLLIKENGLNYAVYLNEGAMVGIFLDQREVRKRLMEKYANGKNVLNTFSYTGAFSVAAAAGGAKKTTSVDVANRSLPKTIEQFSVNGIDYEAQDIIVEDVFKYFKYAVRKKLLFDLVIVDPPSFARSKKHTFSAAKDYKDLLKSVITITADDGVIVASTNCSTFGMQKFKGFIDQAFKETGRKYQTLEEYTLPPDFKTKKGYKEGNYLKVVFVQKLG